MARQLGKPPSSIYDIDDEVIAWSFDRAVLTFGNALESKLQIVGRAAKKQKEAERRVQQEFDRWITSGDDKPHAGRFRDPMKG